MGKKKIIVNVRGKAITIDDPHDIDIIFRHKKKPFKFNL